MGNPTELPHSRPGPHGANGAAGAIDDADHVRGRRPAAGYERRPAFADQLLVQQVEHLQK